MARAPERGDPLAYAAPAESVSEYATLTADDLVTGEAVALDVPPASLGLRMVSGLIDVICTIIVAVAVSFTLLLATVQADGALMHVAVVATLMIVFLVWPSVFETLTRGRSPGKLAMGLRTVRDDGGPIVFQHAFVRALIGFVEIYALSGGPAFLAALMSRRGKRLGDYAAGTYVVRERVRLQLPQPAPMPAPLVLWARTADIASLPPALAIVVRQFLGRAAQMDPRTRAAVAQDLAAQTIPHVSPHPPRGTPPEAFLCAVVAERRDRDARRLAQQHAVRRRLTRR